MKKLLLLGLVPLFSAACATDQSPRSFDDTEERAQQTGRVSMPLTITSTSGTTYALELPYLYLEGPEETLNLSFAEEEELDIDLQEGVWMMEVSGDWVLYKLVNNEWIPVTAEMTSDNPMFFDIYGGETTSIAINFQITDDDTPDDIEFQYGDLEIELEVEEYTESEEPPPV